MGDRKGIQPVKYPASKPSGCQSMSVGGVQPEVPVHVGAEFQPVP